MTSYLKLSDINDAIVKVKKQGADPKYIILGKKQFEDIKCISWSGGMLINVIESNDNKLLNIPMIILSNIEDYFEVQ